MPPRFEQFFAMRRLQPVVEFPPDGEHVLFSGDISGQFNLWRVPIRGARGWPEQLTTFTEHAVRQVRISPDGATILFSADRAGDEFFQLYALPWGGGWPDAWTEAPQVQHLPGGDAWSPDGKRVAFAANARTPTDMEVWVRDVASGETRVVFGEGRFTFPASWSPDGRRLLVVELRSNTDQSLYLVDADGGEARELTPRDAPAKFLPGPWTQDGSGFFLLTDEGREFSGLALYRLAEGKYEWVEAPEADLEEVAGSREAGVVAWLENRDGWGVLRARGASGEMLPEPQLPRGCAYALGAGLTVSRDGRFAALVWQQPRRPADVYVIELATGEAWPVTESMLGGLVEEELAMPELVSIPSFDREIPAWLYRPAGAARAPVLLSIHGGPEAQERPWYQPLYQYLLSRGIAVLAPNIRGSTGYGKSYQRLIYRKWGEDDLRDFDHLAGWLREQEWADPERLAVYGRSYGGFATLTCVTRLPEYWAAAVDVVGPSNLVTFTQSVPPTWRRLMAEWVGDPEADAEFLRERSPISYIDGVRAPLLVMQGANDPRVVKAESDQMVERLRELGREVEYVVFGDEGHGFTKKENDIRANQLAAEWLERHLT